MRNPLRCLAPALLALAGACSSPQAYEGLAPAVHTGGPKVQFDLSHKPLPEIPFPNDLATRVDPDSPTGLRVNASLVAPTGLERNVRSLLDTLDGWGTYAPITISFDKDLDVLDLYARQNDSDPGNDGIYLIDLGSGERARLDLNGGHFPYELVAPQGYFLNDPLAAVSNLLFPIDGPNPNFLHPVDANWPATHGGVPQASDDLLGFYERSTHTLIARPVLPLRQESRYAVVLTNRLKGVDGTPIESCFTGINHAAQTAQLAALPDLLPPGTQLSDVAFAWAFTTQSTTRDLEAIRDGLNGNGPLRQLSIVFPAQQGLTTTAAANVYRTVINIVPSIDGASNPFILPAAKLKELIQDPNVASLIISTDPAEVQALIATLDYVDYFVSGNFTSPDFLADLDRSSNDSSFQLDARKGLWRALDGKIPFILAVPKSDPVHGHTPPFPTAIAAHSYKSARLESVIGFSGTFAKYGVATIAIDAYGHGLGLDPTLEAVARAIFSVHGLDKFADAVFATRARDLDNDGIKDPGGDFWTGDVFHTRDVVRQSIVDWFQLVRILRSFDGTGLMLLPDGTQRLAGDFNNDGVPDVAGPPTWPNDVKVGDGVVFQKGTPNPGSDLFLFGESLGGVLAGVLPALEPAIVSAVTVSGAGGLNDVAIRSNETNVKSAVYLEVFGPFLATCDWSVSDKRCGGAGAQPSLVWNVLKVNNEAVVPIAPLQLQPHDTLTACNLTQLTGPVLTDAELVAQLPEGCKQTSADSAGRLRLSLAADAPFTQATHTPRGVGLPDQVAVQVVEPGDRIHVIVSRAAGGALQALDSWGYDNTFYGISYAKGDALRALGRGFGDERNTPEFRRFYTLSQTILEPGDPINYAPHYFQDPLPAREGNPATVIVMAIAGDPIVPVNTGISMGRAAGLVELDRPDPDYGIPIDQVLIKAGVTEGLARLRRFADPSAGPRAALGAHVRCDPGADCASEVLVDPSGLACDSHGAGCKDGLLAPRLDPPLRAQLTRTSLLAKGGTGVSALMIPYLSRTGQHGFKNPQPSKPFDLDQFLANLTGRYFETRGQELHLEQCQADLRSCSWNNFPPPY